MRIKNYTNRKSNGRYMTRAERVVYQKSQFNRIKWSMRFAFLVMMLGLVGWIKDHDVPEHIEAHAEVVEVVEIVLESPTPSPMPLTQKEVIISEIERVFQDKSEEALLIVACESRFNPQTIGDTHLMHFDEKHQEMVGDSVGTFQIRVGGKGWNRARANGMTANEFREKLKDITYNVEYAKTIYDRVGWSAWYNCGIKTGLLTNE